MPQGTSSCLLLPDKEFLFELSGQALSPVCRKTCGRDPRPRPASSLDLFHPSSAARSVRARACTAESAVPNRFRFDSENLLGAARPRGHPAGCVFSLQTFGAYGANFNPHCHGLVTDGVFPADGQFLPLPSLDASAVMETFRCMLLLRLHQAERLSESFMQNLLSWVHPGFSVYAGPPVDAAEIASLESQARDITRPAVAMDALRELDEGRLVMETPPDPRTGATLIELDPLEWIHRITSHLPDPGKHCQRFYGAYSNRSRIRLDPGDGESAALPAASIPAQDDSDCSRHARSLWARLIRKIFEADPMLCPCGGRMRILSFISV